MSNEEILQQEKSEENTNSQGLKVGDNFVILSTDDTDLSEWYSELDEDDGTLAVLTIETIELESQLLWAKEDCPYAIGISCVEKMPSVRKGFKNREETRIAIGQLGADDATAWILTVRCLGDNCDISDEVDDQEDRFLKLFNNGTHPTNAFYSVFPEFKTVELG